MAIKIGVKYSMAETDRMVTYPIAYPVDDNNTNNRIAWGKLVTLKMDGTSAKTYGTANKPTWILADNTYADRPAMAVIYDTSLKNQFTNGLNVDDELFMYAKGYNHETNGLVPLQDVFLEVFDDTDPNAGVYNAVKKALAGTVTFSAGSVKVVGTATAFTTDLSVGEYVVVGTEVIQVKSIESDTAFTVVEAFENAASGATIYKDSMIGKPLYLSTDGDFTEIKPTTGKIQIIGEIMGSQSIRIYLYGSESIKAETLAEVKVAKVDITAPADGSETGTGFTLPANAVVKNVFLRVNTAEATGTTKTLTVGTDSTASGDADGYLVAVDVSATGLVKGTLSSTGQTLGALLTADEDGAGALVPEIDAVSGGKEITVTAGSADFAELDATLFVEYIDVK